MDPIEHMTEHVRAGDKVWVRRRRVPLTAEQSAALTAFVERQDGKPFAVLRLMGQMTPFRSRGPLRTWVVGKPHGDREEWFCSELVTESCVAAGLMDADTARPAATYPRDLFFGQVVQPVSRQAPLPRRLGPAGAMDQLPIIGRGHEHLCG